MTCEICGDVRGIHQRWMHALADRVAKLEADREGQLAPGLTACFMDPEQAHAVEAANKAIASSVCATCLGNRRVGAGEPCPECTVHKFGCALRRGGTDCDCSVADLPSAESPLRCNGCGETEDPPPYKTSDGRYWCECCRCKRCGCSPPDGNTCLCDYTPKPAGKPTAPASTVPAGYRLADGGGLSKHGEFSCTHSSDGRVWDCNRDAVYDKNQATCSEHAVEMGALEPLPAEPPSEPARALSERVRTCNGTGLKSLADEVAALERRLGFEKEQALSTVADLTKRLGEAERFRYCKACSNSGLNPANPSRTCQVCNSTPAPTGGDEKP